MGIRVGVIRGNGIGPEITQATLRVLEACLLYTSRCV